MTKKPRESAKKSTSKTAVQNKKVPVKKTPAPTTKTTNRALLQKRLKVKTSPKKSLVEFDRLVKKMKGSTATPPKFPELSGPGVVVPQVPIPPGSTVLNTPEATVAKKITRPNNPYPIWPDAECGACGNDASDDPNGDCFLYTISCPTCQKIGCDECMPAGRGCNCPDCEQTAEAT